MGKIIKTFVIEVHGYNNADIETGLEEASNRIHYMGYNEGMYSESDESIDGKIRGFKCEITNGITDFIECTDLVLDQ